MEKEKKKNDGHWLHGFFRTPTQEELLKKGGIISGKAINTSQPPFLVLVHLLQVYCSPEGVVMDFGVNTGVFYIAAALAERSYYGWLRNAVFYHDSLQKHIPRVLSQACKDVIVAERMCSFLTTEATSVAEVLDDLDAPLSQASSRKRTADNLSAESSPAAKLLRTNSGQRMVVTED